MKSFRDFSRDKYLKDISTFGIGGPADFYAVIETIAEMKDAINLCREQNLRYLILGKGSNTLFDDKGFKGVILHNRIDFFNETNPGQFYVGAGYSFSLLGTQTARKGWSGLEFASGIPGSVGGAVFMNAGANGKETCDHLKSVDYLTEEGVLKTLNKEELTFSYRSSSFQTMRGAIVAASFSLIPSESARKAQIDIVNYRTRTQPYGEKSAGCIFRNPGCSSAGALIDQCGLKGLQIGGAKVSEKHANFIINSEGGTAEDVKNLIGIIASRVREKTGIELDSEVRYIPYQEIG